MDDLHDPSDPPPAAGRGRPFGKYTLVEELGAGGMGVVWKAWDPDLQRFVALKRILGAEDAGDAESIERFLREARTAARLRHPHIVGVHEIGRHEGEVFFTSDCVEGVSLDRWMRADRSPAEAARIVQRVAEALAHAHAHGVVHRDVKPGNILVDGEDRPYLTDFGLARDAALQGPRYTKSGTHLGTPHYMSPEQAEARASAVGPASDQFSLGIVLYEMLAGRLPFQGRMIRDLLVEISTKDPPPPSRTDPRVSRDLDTICLRALEKDPARRYPDAGELAADLARFLAGEPIAARPVSTIARLSRTAMRHRRVVFPSLVAVALALALGGTIASDRRERTRSLEAALEEARALEDRGELTPARDACLRALDLSPSDARAGERLAEIERKIERRRRLEEATRVRAERTGRAFHELEGARHALQAARDLLHRRDATAREFRAALEVARGPVDDAIALAPDLAPARFVLAEWLELSGRRIEAEAAVREAIALDPSHAPARLLAGRLLVRRAWEGAIGVTPESSRERRERQLVVAEEAARQIEAAFAASGGLEDPLRREIARAILESLRASTDGAWSEWSRALALALERFDGRPGVEELHLLAARFASDASARERSLELALAIRPHFPEALYFRARRGLDRGDLAGAIRDVECALDFDPWFAKAWALAAHLRSLEGSIDLARPAIDRAIELDGGDPLIFGARADIRLRQGELDGAIADATRAVELEPRYWLGWYVRGRARLAAGGDTGPTAALADLDRAVEAAPHLSAVHLQRAIARVRAGDREGALAGIAQTLRIDPVSADAYEVLADLHSRNGDVPAAFEATDRALALDPLHPGRWVARAALSRSLGLFAFAIRDLRRALRLSPGDAEIGARLEEVSSSLSPEAEDRARRAADEVARASFAIEAGDLGAAAGHCDRAIELDPYLPHAYDDRGIVRWRRGDLAGAREDFDRALRLDPAFSQSRLHRALVRAALGDRGGAIDDLRQALLLAPDGWEGRSNAQEALAELERSEGR